MQLHDESQQHIPTGSGTSCKALTAATAVGLAVQGCLRCDNNERCKVGGGDIHDRNSLMCAECLWLVIKPFATAQKKMTPIMRRY